MTYRDIYIYTPLSVDFMNGFEIVKKIFNSIPPNVIVNGRNFNRYTSEGDDNRIHITIHLDLNVDEIPPEVTVVLNEMRGREITDWQIDHPTVTGLDHYSSNHHTAHETSTECALTFYDIVRRRPEVLAIFQNNQIENLLRFLLSFLPILLQNCNLIRLENPPSRIDPFIRRLVNACTRSYNNTVNTEKITDFPLFFERFIHLFLNSINIPVQIETELRRIIFQPRES